MGSVTVLVIAPDERWLRVLEATLRLGGYRTITRRSIDEAVRLRASDPLPTAVVIDMGADVRPDEVGVIRGLLTEHRMLRQDAAKLIMILPEQLAELRHQFVEGDPGIEVLVRPYPPSSLFAAIGPSSSAIGTPSPEH